MKNNGNDNLKGQVVKVACIQMESKVGEIEQNSQRAMNFIKESLENKAELIVLPELVISGYMFNSRKEAFQCSEEIPNGPTTKAWAEIAKEHNAYIVGGICERDGDKLFNSGILVGPNGYIGKYQKHHLWFEEKLFFEPGDKGFPIFKTEIGNIGILICFDLWFPEPFRIMATMGADIICLPTNWVPTPGQKEGELIIANHLSIVNSHVNSIFIAAADKVGTDRNQAFSGCSLITGPAGWPLTKIAGTDTQEIIYADCNLTDSRKVKRWTELNHIILDRRDDVYDRLLGYKHFE